MLLTDERHIAHFDLDTFFVSVERLRQPKLEGVPVMIGGGERGVVASCSYEARRFGVHSAMPMHQARRLCPQAVVLPVDMDAYSQYSRVVTQVIEDNVPLFERTSIDEFYIDLTGMDRFFGCRKFTDELKAKVKKEAGLVISYGLSSNKLVSKVATNEAKPNGQIQVPLGYEKKYLAPLSVLKIPGVGAETGLLLLKMGVETVKVLSEIPREMMLNLLGKPGVDLWRKANGIDESPVIPYREQKSIGTENTFNRDTIDVAFLHSELVRMTEKIGFELRQQNKLTGRITVKIRYSTFETYSKQITIPYTNADNVLLQTAHALFNKLYDRRLLVRLIGIRLNDLIPGNHQINLFEDTQENIRLFQAIDSIKKQFGQEKLVRGSSMKSLRIHESVR